VWFLTLPSLHPSTFLENVFHTCLHAFFAVVQYHIGGCPSLSLAPTPSSVHGKIRLACKAKYVCWDQVKLSDATLGRRIIWVERRITPFSAQKA